MSMGPGAGGPPWRFLRSDRSVIDNKIERQTVRRVLGFARPHRRLITAFLAVTVVDAALVVAPPLLLKAIIDDGVRTGDVSLVDGSVTLKLDADVASAARSGGFGVGGLRSGASFEGTPFTLGFFLLRLQARLPAPEM